MRPREGLNHVQGHHADSAAHVQTVQRMCTPVHSKAVHSTHERRQRCRQRLPCRRRTPSTAQHMAVYRRTVTASQLRAPGAAGAGVRREGGRRRLRVAPLAVAIGVRHQRRKLQVVRLEPRPRVDAAVDVCGTRSLVGREGVLYQQASSLHEQCHRTNRRTFANPDEPEAKAELENDWWPT